ncbi:unnamed protein product [Euphydryas editha]|uniref:Uncharacterized protein n=1 Tax=Euphydryas editha TaxID=104508 RepID=A0AAU9UDR3_EUPED|nr:unnamed protein product [Euphydryas editha]
MALKRCISTLRIDGETEKGKRLKWSAAIGCFAPMAAGGGAIGAGGRSFCARAHVTVARHAANVQLYQHMW